VPTFFTIHGLQKGGNSATTGCGNLIVHPPQFRTFAALRKVETEQHFHNQLNYFYGDS